ARRHVARQQATHNADLDCARLRMVPVEMRRIDVDAPDEAGNAKADDTPVVSRPATPARLPAIHPFPVIGIFTFAANWRLGLDQMVLGPEELVVGRHDGRTETLGSEIDET